MLALLANAQYHCRPHETHALLHIFVACHSPSLSVKISKAGYSRTHGTGHRATGKSPAGSAAYIWKTGRISRHVDWRADRILCVVSVFLMQSPRALLRIWVLIWTGTDCSRASLRCSMRQTLGNCTWQRKQLDFDKGRPKMSFRNHTTTVSHNYESCMYCDQGHC